jgi:hypothetical protein
MCVSVGERLGYLQSAMGMFYCASSPNLNMVVNPLWMHLGVDSFARAVNVYDSTQLQARASFKHLRPLMVSDRQHVGW